MVTETYKSLVYIATKRQTILRLCPLFYSCSGAITLMLK